MPTQTAQRLLVRYLVLSSSFNLRRSRSGVYSRLINAKLLKIYGINFLGALQINLTGVICDATLDRKTRYAFAFGFSHISASKLLSESRNSASQRSLSPSAGRALGSSRN